MRYKHLAKLLKKNLKASFEIWHKCLNETFNHQRVQCSNSQVLDEKHPSIKEMIHHVSSHWHPSAPLQPAVKDPQQQDVRVERHQQGNWVSATVHGSVLEREMCRAPSDISTKRRTTYRISTGEPIACLYMGTLDIDKCNYCT